MNKSILSKVVIFVAGAAVGSVVTWKLIETKYKQIADEEIASVKEVFSKRNEETKTEEPVEEEDEEDDIVMPNHKPDLSEYKELVKSYGYNNKEEEEEVNDDMDIAPYVIKPEAFGDDDYETVSLTMYADGIVTDEYDVRLDDEEIEDLIGKESLTHFGEYEDDSVFVRNESRQTDYEILADERNYFDLYPQEVEE